MQKDLVGQRYRLKGLIGEGGMASVYAALDEKLDRRVAIKILHPHLARNKDIRDRFLLEAKTVSTLDHPNIIKVYDFSGLESEQLWMVTEILYGVDLAEYVKRFSKNRLHPIVATLISREICRALYEVHKLKIVHRDIKPENIMMLDNGQVKLMDFGIAKVNRANATQTGTFMGSPSYMSPEQIRGGDIDVRADIYSLSVLYYEIVTGTLPYMGQTTAEVINKIMVGRYTPPNLLAPELPYALNEVIVRGMQSQREQRFQDILQMIQSIDLFLKSHGFGESRSELEQYILNRSQFEERLSKLKLPRAQISRIESHKNVLNQSNPSAKSGNASETHYEANPQGSSKKSPSKQKSSSAPGQANLKPSPMTLHLDDVSDVGDRRSKQLYQKEPTNLPKHDSSVVKSASQPPSTRTRNTNSPISSGGKSPKRQPYIKEYSSSETKGKGSASSNRVLLAAVAAIILGLVIFAGERLSNRPKRDTAKISQQTEIAKKKKSRDDREEIAPATQVPAGSETGLAKSISESPTVVAERNQVEAEALPPPQKDADREATVQKPVRSLPPPRSLAGSTNSPRAGSGSNNNINPAATPDKNLAMKAPTTVEEQVPSPSPDALPVSVPLDRPTPATDVLPTEPPQPTRGPGILKIAALPAAEILLDGKLYGTTNDREIISQGIRLEPGTYSLRLRRKGYRPDDQTVMIRAGETRQLNIALAKTIDLVEFTVRSNRTPASLVIEDLKGGGRKREITLSKPIYIINLKPGSYRVMVSSASDTINRVIELGDADKSITFNADFK